jgi:hypothetical protein
MYFIIEQWKWPVLFLNPAAVKYLKITLLKTDFSQQVAFNYSAYHE